MAKKKKTGFGTMMLGAAVVGNSIGKKIGNLVEKSMRTEIKPNGKIVVHNKKKKKLF